MTQKSNVASATPKQPKLESLKAWAMPKVDWLVKVLAGAFFIATSYGYVAEWLKTHQAQHDLSTAGGIMVVSIALYLFIRKR